MRSDKRCMNKRICYMLCYGRAIAYKRYSIYAVARKKLLILPSPPLFEAPARANPLEFLDETPQKLWGYRMVKNS